MLFRWSDAKIVVIFVATTRIKHTAMHEMGFQIQKKIVFAIMESGRTMKKIYKWLHNHDIGMLRFLYLSPIVAALTPWQRLIQFVLMVDIAIAITYSAGQTRGWYKED